MINSISLVNLNTVNFGSRKQGIYNRCYDTFEFQNSISNQIEKFCFNYSLSNSSSPLKTYDGPLDNGISTEDPQLGGGWLVGNINTPLSTTGVRTCAVLNLVNEDKGEHILYHVYHKTTADKIEQFINDKMPDFTYANIVGGDQFKTVNTMRKIINALDNVNPHAPKYFYHSLSENPEIVAYNGDMFYMKGVSDDLSFERNDKNYWY